MKIKLKVVAEIDINVDLTNDVLDEVVRFYDGNFKSYFESNYREYFNEDDMDFELDKCDFDEKEAKKVLKNAREIIGSSEKNPRRGHINILRFEQSFVGKTDSEQVKNLGELEEVNVDIEAIEKTVEFSDINNPKNEFNFIHLKGNIIEATDTRKLIRIDNHKYHFRDILFPPSFIEPLKRGGKLLLNRQNNLLYIEYDGSIYDGYRKSSSNYSDIDKIIPKMENLSHKLLSSLSIKECTIDNCIDCIEIEFNDTKIYLDMIHYSRINALTSSKAWFATNMTKDGLLPVFFYDKNVVYSMMPTSVGKYDSIEYKK